MQWIKERGASDEPFFAYIAPNAPHWPLFVSQQYRDPYASLPHDQASFYGMIANIDENMGKLEEMLVQEGLRDNTIVIFLTDNGTVYGDVIFNAGIRGEKGTLYEGGHRVPFFVRWPTGNLRDPGERRWPVEADAAITAGLPPYVGVDGTYVEGRALPIAYARLKVGKFDQTVSVTETDKVISFNVNLPSGPTDLQTWFLDPSRKLLTGAYYVHVTRR